MRKWFIVRSLIKILMNPIVFLTATAAEGTTPKVDGIEEIINAIDFAERCLNCPHHPD